LDVRVERDQIPGGLHEQDESGLAVRIDLTPTPRTDYRMWVPKAGAYYETLDSDADYFGGSNVIDGPRSIMAEQQPWMNDPYSLTVTPPAPGPHYCQDGRVADGRAGRKPYCCHCQIERRGAKVNVEAENQRREKWAETRF
jgi:hypothetical protein